MQTETIIPDNVEAIIEAYFKSELEKVHQANLFDGFGKVQLSVYGFKDGGYSSDAYVSIANALVKPSESTRICDAVSDQVAKLNMHDPRQAKLDRMAEIAAEMERLEAELDAEVVS